ncbi:preprotein translocase subunit YajC [Kiritimatiella glycovorans]|uniref:Sec translocon accessory complex subunit YajC n=1 Tax=Kiritimatiella glycovorans TaxID=1307763 RepID=A0A0G3ECN5_9BACT|nr:preprotein translocase subunit YajC [Kiritimatiella glycovorans]AKJ64063.1 preprotein translocase subunit YajC [Kiritimatiella glycovorans]
MQPWIPMLAQAAQPQQGEQSPIFMFGWLIIMIAIFYFLLIRPQRKREKQRQQLIASVKSGDQVLLTSGMIGRVSNVKDRIFTVKIAENVKVDVVKSAVSRVLTDDDTLEGAENAG